MMRRSKVKYKAVIFDFDYTLGDCTEGIAVSYTHLTLPTTPYV